MVKLRDYQINFINDLRKAIVDGNTSICAVLPTGAGKTIITGAMIKSALEQKQKKCWFIVHRNELITQTAKKFDLFDLDYGFITAGEKSQPGKNLYLAMNRTLLNRFDSIPEEDLPDLIFIDECFPAGTKIDNKNIEDLKIGDKVLTFNHKKNIFEKKPILNIFKKEVNQICEIKFTDGTNLICTPNHPIFDGEIYKPAMVFKRDDVMCYTDGHHAEMYSLQSKRNETRYKIKKINLFEISKRLLQRSMSRRISPQNQLNNNGKNKQTICFTQDEKKQSYEKFNNKGQSFNYAKSYETHAQNQKREWDGPNCYRTSVIESFGVAYECYIPNTIKIKRWLSSSLQNRYSKRNFKNCNRSRWKFSLCFSKKRARQEETRSFGIKRVESLKVYQRGNQPEFDSLCSKGIVYNIETKDNNNYFADNILVHNCHHIRAGEYEKLLQKILSKKKPIIIGLTATPKRLDGKGLKDCFQTIVLGPKVKDLMEMGNLSKYKIVAPPNDLDSKKIATKFGDYDQKELAKQIEQADIFGGLVWNYKRYLDGKNLIVFAQNVDHSKKITQIYNEAGIPAAHLDGTMSQAERQKIIQGFEAGEIKVICNCFLISEGFDVPACGGIQLVRKTKSEALYLQMVGRALRPEDGKEHATILDHCKNWEENGFPCDDREWKLEYPKKRKSDQTAPVKRCFYCYAVNHASARACLDCGHVFPIETNKKDPKSLDGELVYIDIDGIRKKFGSKEEKNQYVKDRLRYCREESDFRALALQVGYKPSWGWVKYQLRIKKLKGNLRGSKSGFNKNF